MLKKTLALTHLNFLTLAFIVLYTLAALLVCLNRYYQYQNFYFDLGIYDRAIWQVAHWQLPLVDHVDFGDQKIISLGDHFNPSVFLIAPFYWFTNKTEMLLVVQVFSVSLSAILIFLIARKKLQSQLAVLALVVAYLGFVGLQNALISDFHEVTVALLPLVGLFWAIFNHKWKLYFLLLLVLLGFKETLAGLGIGLGIYLLFRERKRWWLGLSTILISLIWGIVVIKLVIPYLSGGIYLYNPKNLPISLAEVIGRFISPPLTVKTIIYSYLNFGFIPLLNLAIFPMIIENFIERFVLSPDKGRDLGMHYSAVLSPLMTIASLEILIWMEKHRTWVKIVPFYAVSIIMSTFILHRFILHGPLGLAYNPIFYQQNEKSEYVNRFVAHFPQKGIIMTQNDLAVRLTHQDVRLLRSNYQIINPDYIILNLTPGQNPNSFYPLKFEEAVTLKDRLLKDQNYTLIKYTEEEYFFSKKGN